MYFFCLYMYRGDFMKNKVRLLAVPLLALMIFSVGGVLAAGFDEFGYNDKSRLFNGWYGYYDRAIDEGGWVEGTGDAWILMKWSKDWTPMIDEPVGAWCTNHWTWYTNDVFQERWDVTGTWIIAVNNGRYLHDYAFTMTSIEGGTFTGTGGYPSGAADYTFDEVLLSGQITGDTITFTAKYLQNNYVWTGTGTIDADGHLVAGTGNSGVYEWHSTSGQAVKVQTDEINGWYGFEDRVAWGPDKTAPDAQYMVTEFMKVMKVGDNAEMWAIYETGGAYDAGWGTYADGVPMYVVFQDVVTVYDTETGAMVGEYDLCTAAPHGLGQPIF